jgi:hypothetical protein
LLSRIDLCLECVIKIDRPNQISSLIFYAD